MAIRLIGTEVKLRKLQLHTGTERETNVGCGALFWRESAMTGAWLKPLQLQGVCYQSESCSVKYPSHQMSAEHYPLRVGYLNMPILFSTLTASLMMRVITALGRFRSSGLSAISLTAQRRFEPGLTILFTPQYGRWCGPWIRRSSAISEIARSS